MESDVQRAPAGLPSLDPTGDPVEFDPIDPIVRPSGWRRWMLRGFVVILLIGGVVTVAVAAHTIASQANETSKRKAISGVYLPDQREYREVTGKLVARKTPKKLRGMTIVGREGEVTVIKAVPGKPSLLSSYLNPNALEVIARAIGNRTDDPITIEELRLEVLKSTGRQRWRLRGTQAGRPWRAVVAPNGTGLRLLPTRDT